MKKQVRLVIRCRERLRSGRYFYTYKVVDKDGRVMATDGSSDPSRLREQALWDLKVFETLLKMGHDLSLIPSYPELVEMERRKER